ncbi:MAG TPA: choice-of-anchor Q domain-containing protein [Crinalium sp.]|jgi:parallel beta-helix repeat protein
MGKIYYISGEGSNNNNGLSPQSAFRTLQQAADLTQPGDVVYVMNGTYTNDNSFDNILTIKRSGTPDAWITYQAYPGHHPKLESKNWHGIDVQGASYITIDGFELEGNNNNINLAYAQSQQTNLNNPLTSGNGIGVNPSTDGRFSHHIVIRNNKAYNFGGGGIYTIHADYVTIENNTVYNNAWYAPYGCSGISNYQNWNSDNSTDTKMIIRNNVSYGNQNLIPFYAMGKITDGNGIIIDDSRNTQLNSTLGSYKGRTLIQNNIVYNNGGRGVAVYKSEFVDVINNTAYQNSQHSAIRDGEITAIAANNVNVFNNIIYAKTGLPANTVFDVRNVLYDYNLVFNAAWFIDIGSHNVVGKDPLFVDPATGNFSLRANSPAVNLGTRKLAPTVDFLGVQRSDAGIDMGAYESKSLPQGTSGVDILTGTELADVLDGKQGNDQLLGNAGSDMLLGGSGNDILLGGDGDDSLLGDAGSDRLMGDNGNDRLIGGGGKDSLLGGNGQDIFGLKRKEGRDLILDFQDGYDKLTLAGGLTWRSLTVTQQGQNTLIRAGKDELALLKNVLATSITAVDFR